MARLDTNTIDQNESAFSQFMQMAVGKATANNGKSLTLKAHVAYYHKGTDTPSYNRKVNILISTLIMGGHTLSIGSLTGKTQYFNEYNTNYQQFRIVNNVLVIEGTDDYNTGKGDYMVCITL